MTRGLEQLKSIKSFPSLVKYLRDELDWPIESDDVENLTFEYEPEELGLDKQTAVKVKEIKQLRPLADNQPWGIFYINFEPKRLPIVALRRILRSLVIKKRASGSRSQQRAWHRNDLLFISSYGETDGREMTFAHFSENSEMGDLPTLKVLGWSAGNTVLRLEDTHTTLKEKLRWPEDETGAEEWRRSWASAFKLQYRETVRTSKDLAVKLARLAEDVRERVNAVLSIESERGELRKLYKAFQEALIHDLDEDDFADMYAQTIAYGLLSASISRQSGALVADNLKDMVPNTNPFLKELMQTFLTAGGRKGRIDFDELGINEVVELLRHTRMDEVLKDFGARNPQEDPVIHFYELFLKEYDPEKRMKRGVFYTPRPVVSFIVRSVDEILRTEFGLEDGLADTTTWGEMRKRHAGLTIPEGVRPDEPFVQILDPATGTGTFLVEVIDRIYVTLRAKWRREGKNEREMRDLWNNYVPRHLLPRLHGFELMMAPYAIAHMKLGLKLTETKYSFLSSERARIYLTNTLEEPKDFSGYFEQMAPALAHEAAAANEVKRRTPITVVVGNPPYSRSSTNTGEYIEELMDSYKELAKDERNIQPLSDDYIKFFRYGQEKLSTMPRAVLGMITNNIYFSGRIHRGMRHELSVSFNRAQILDLHGSSRVTFAPASGEEDQNVFDIQQGVGISVLWRDGRTKSGIRKGDVTGQREHKYRVLAGGAMSDLALNELRPSPPYYLWTVRSENFRDEFFNYVSLTDLFGFYSVSGKPGDDDLLISIDEADVIPKLRRLRKAIDDNRAGRLTEAGRKLAARPSGVAFSPSKIVRYAYRPFDNRWTYYDPKIWTRAVGGLKAHFGGLPALLTTKLVKDGSFAHVFTARLFPDVIFLSNKSSVNCYSFPLGLSEGQALLKQFGGPAYNLDAGRMELSLSIHVPPQTFYHWIYAVLHSPAYRERYFEFLQYDFPRIPLTSDAELFRELCAFGADLVALHLLEDDYEAASWNVARPKGKSPLKTPITRFAGRGGAEVVKGYPKHKDGNVYINSSRYFEGVPEEVWNFHVGGYQVCEKWLKDRRERTLSEEDIAHYRRVVVALNETIRLMAEIDRTIEEHGGWPLVGSQETTHQQPAPSGLPFT